MNVCYFFIYLGKFSKWLLASGINCWQDWLTGKLGFPGAGFNWEVHLRQVWGGQTAPTEHSLLSMNTDHESMTLQYFSQHVLQSQSCKATVDIPVPWTLGWSQIDSFSWCSWYYNNNLWLTINHIGFILALRQHWFVFMDIHFIFFATRQPGGSCKVLMKVHSSYLYWYKLFVCSGINTWPVWPWLLSRKQLDPEQARC